MARANRHYIPGYIRHITPRCHKREFLLKFSKDRHRYLQWLYQARKRYGICILNCMVTSNHIHLLVADTGERNVIPNSMQLVAGRTGQEYNQRKDRKGAFWEDRYRKVNRWGFFIVPVYHRKDNHEKSGQEDFQNHLLRERLSILHC